MQNEQAPLLDQVATKHASLGWTETTLKHVMEKLSANSPYRHEDALKLIAWRLAQGLPKNLRVPAKTQRSDS